MVAHHGSTRDHCTGGVFFERDWLDIGNFGDGRSRP
jgi:hypothetical protein